MSTDAQPAASSAAPSPAPTAAPAAATPTPAPTETAPRSLESLTSAQLQNWRLTGELPDAPPDSPSAEIGTAPPEDQAASTDATTEAASEPAEPARGKEKRKKELDAEIQELLQRRAALRAELEQPPPTQAPATDASPGSSPAVSEGAEFPEFDAWAEMPGNAGRSYEAYTRELTRHVYRQEERARHDAHARAERVKACRQRVDEAAKADPEFYKSLAPEVVTLPTFETLQPGEQPTSLHVLGQEILQSEHAARLMRHFSEHKADLQAMARGRAADVVRFIGKLEARFEAAAAPAPTTPPITQAPEPPVTLGSKATAPADDVEAAIARGDYAAYARAQTARELAQAGRR